MKKTWKEYAEQAGRVKKLWHRRVNRELDKVGDACGPLISGIVSDAFPNKAKSRLRAATRVIETARKYAHSLRPKGKHHIKHRADIRILMGL